MHFRDARRRRTIKTSTNYGSLKSNRLHRLLTLSQTTNLRLFQTERVSEINVNGRKLSRREENTVEKEEIAPFPVVFSKGLYCSHVKTKACLGKG